MHKKRGRISRGAKTLVTTGNMFLIVVHSVRERKNAFGQAELFILCLETVGEQQKPSQQRAARPDAGRPLPPMSVASVSSLDVGHDWKSESHTMGTRSARRTFQLERCVRNPTKTRDTAKLILKKRFNFTVGKLVERKQKHCPFCCLDLQDAVHTNARSHVLKL